MSEARAARDRRLIQRTAALLSDDYPLEQLIERVCDALCSELGAHLAFVALADGERHLQIEGFVGVRDGALPDVTAHSAALLAFRANETVVSGDGSDLAAPIAYRDRVLGVLALSAESAGAFDKQDEHLIRAIARYLAIVIRNQRISDRVERQPRTPVVAIFAVVVFALLLSVAIGAFATIRADESRTAQDELMQGRLHDIVDQMNWYVLDARQLASSAANIVGHVRNDRQRVEHSLLALLRSARSSTIYGVGAWYEPYRFDGKTRWYGPYAHWSGHHRPVLTYDWMRPSYDFQRQPWYRLGKTAIARVVFTNPYFDTDHVYVTAAKAFVVDGRVAGVVTVDSILPTLRSSMPLRLPPSDFAVVTTHGGSVLLTSDNSRIGPSQLSAHVRDVAGPNAVDASARVPYTGWIVQIFERRSVYAAEARRLQVVAAIAIVGIWLAAALTILVALRSRRHARRAMLLEEQQGVLEREIAERVRAEELLREHAYRDELTGLPNRAFFIAQLGAQLDAMRLEDESLFAVLFIDIDRFNAINDSLGHVTGDRLLAEFGTRLASHARSGDVLARLSGDEFVLLARIQEQGEARRRAAEILQALRHPFTFSGLEFFVTASIGIAIADPRHQSAEEMLRDADVAMYEAKRAGRATFRVFDLSMHADALERLALETDLRRALERDELYVEYQPLVALHDGSIAGFEALARWRHATRGQVPPETFIKIAEQSGLIVEIDERVIGMACAAAAIWRAEHPELFVAVNFSAAHLARVDDLAIVRGALESSGLPPSALKIEITESAVMEDTEKAFALLLGLRELGVTVVVDDFGTGYSSLSQLQRLPVEELKVDRSFVRSMLQNERAAEIVRAILAISKTLRLMVTAEGVETQEQADRLRRMGVEFAQGMNFGMSVDADMAMRLLRTRLKRSVRV